MNALNRRLGEALLADGRVRAPAKGESTAWQLEEIERLSARGII